MIYVAMTVLSMVVRMTKITVVRVAMAITIRVILRVDIRDSDAIPVWMIRDSQRKKIYDSEKLVFHPDTLNPTPEWKSLREVQDFVDLVTASDTWKALGVGNQRPISVRDGRGRRSAGADPYLDFITMPKGTRSRWVALHELAHIAEIYRADWDDVQGGWPYYEILVRADDNWEKVPIRTTAPTAPSSRVYTSTWWAAASPKTTTASKPPSRSAR